MATEDVKTNYSELKRQITIILKTIYEDYKKDKVIFAISGYANEFVSRTYLRKLVDLGIIRKITNNKKNMQYVWNSDDNPNFEELSGRILKETGQKSKFTSVGNEPNYSYCMIKLSHVLSKNGLSDVEKNYDLTNEIMEIFFPGHQL